MGSVPKEISQDVAPVASFTNCLPSKPFRLTTEGWANLTPLSSTFTLRSNGVFGLESPELGKELGYGFSIDSHNRADLNCIPFSAALGITGASSVLHSFAREFSAKLRL